jgi:hypothetical protein
MNRSLKPDLVGLVFDTFGDVRMLFVLLLTALVEGLLNIFLNVLLIMALVSSSNARSAICFSTSLSPTTSLTCECQ